MHIWQIKIYAGTDTGRESDELCLGLVRAASARQAILFAAEPIVDADTSLTVELNRLPDDANVTVDDDHRAHWSPRKDGAAIRPPRIEDF